MDRKEFIKTCGIACMGATTIAWLQSCTGLSHYATANKLDRKLVIKKSEFTQTAKGKTTERGYVLVKTEELNFPICVYHLGGNKYTALLMECTHKSCELQPHGDYLICPCHGSEFTRQGLVQNPPAEQDLKTFNITSDGDNLYIHL